MTNTDFRSIPDIPQVDRRHHWQRQTTGRVMNNLPPLNPLRAFEAAGRLKSIRKAAEELSVTAGAVSRQVQILETHLGVPLFRREARSATLTAAGEKYLAEITEHLDGIREATMKLTGARGHPSKILKVRAYVTFAMKWLIPRLSSFHNANPTMEVLITASLEAVDFENEDVDCAIRLGDGHWPEYEVDRLVANELVPVCSPKFRWAAKLKNPSDLAGRTLLHSLSRPDDWKHWLRAAGQIDIEPYGSATPICIFPKASITSEVAQTVRPGDEASTCDGP